MESNTTFETNSIESHTNTVSNERVQSEINDTSLYTLTTLLTNSTPPNPPPRRRTLPHVTLHHPSFNSRLRHKYIHHITMSRPFQLILQVGRRLHVGRYANFRTHLAKILVRHHGHGLPHLLVQQKLPHPCASDGGGEAILSEADEEQAIVAFHQERRQAVGQVRSSVPDALQRRVLHEDEVGRERDAQPSPPRDFRVVGGQCLEK